jgi:hypothetical protein
MNERTNDDATYECVDVTARDEHAGADRLGRSPVSWEAEQEGKGSICVVVVC